MFRKRFLWHPFLFALFPVFSLLALNRYQISPKEALLPGLTVFFTSAIFVLFLGALFSNKRKAGLVVSLFFLAFFSFGHIREAVDGFTLSGLDIGRDRSVLVFLAAIFLAGVYEIVRMKRDFANLTRIANAVALVLVMIPLGVIGVYELQREGARITGVGIDTENRGEENAIMPNIYYIILDGYGSETTLKEIYDYDNSEFVEFLEKKGFFIAEESVANYAWTFLSLASSLNMEYLDFVADAVGKDSKNREVVFPLLSDNAVQRFLKSKGYTSIHISSTLHRLTDWNEYADVNFKAGKLDEFSQVLLRTTALYPFLRDRVSADRRESVLYSFDTLADVARLAGPRFVFAHIMLPHPPFALGPNGEEIEDPKSDFPPSYNSWKFKEAYLDQITFANKKVEELIDVILPLESSPPIIIIQGDHGPASEGPEDEREMDYSATDRLAKERMKILNAYYLPRLGGAGSGMLYNSITPVNSFRLIFSQYFNADYPLLEDKSFTSTEERPYDFIDVTIRVITPHEE